MLEILVGGDKEIKALGGELKQLAVAQTDQPASATVATS
jgi:hypothetical protein